MVNLENIPPEILYLIFQNLSIKNIFKIIGLNKNFINICDSDLFWELKFKFDYGKQINNNQPWKQTYKTCKSEFIKNKNMDQKIIWSINNGYLNLSIKLLSKIFKNQNPLQKIINYFNLNLGSWILKAIEQNSIIFIKILYKIILDHKINLSENIRRQIFYTACEYGRLWIVQFLFEQNQEINFEYDNFFPLFAASQYNHHKIIKFLLDNGGLVFLNKKSSFGASSLYIACQKNSLESAEILLKYGADPENKYIGYSPLFVAAQNGHAKIIELLCNYKIDINYYISPYGTTALYLAVQHNNLQVVKILLNNKANINILYKYYSPLYLAVEKGYSDIVKLFYESGYNINFSNKKGYIPFYFACKKGHIDIVNYFIEKGFNLNEKYKNKSPLTTAINNRRYNIVKILIQNGAEI